MSQTVTVNDIDLFAIRIVVREERQMNLRREEQIVAAKLMNRKGYSRTQIGIRLGVTEHLADKMMRMEWPVNPDDIPENVYGPKLMPFQIEQNVLNNRASA